MERKRQKLSGNQYRQKRLKRMEKEKRLRNDMQDFLIQQPSSEASSTPPANSSNFEDKNPALSTGTPPPSSLILNPADKELMLHQSLVGIAEGCEEEKVTSPTSPENYQQPGSSSKDIQQATEAHTDPALWDRFHMSSGQRRRQG